MRNSMNMNWMTDLRKDTRGQDLVEYALMAAFIAVSAGVVMPGIAGSIGTMFQSASTILSSVASSGAPNVM